MAIIAHNAKLNDLVIDLGRNLLQYSHEGDAWTADAAVEQRLAGWASAQQADVGRIVDVLATRGWPIDLGTYPTDFTDLQFLSLDYLLPKILMNQERLVGELDEAVHTCVDDPEAVDLLREVAANERKIAGELQTQVAAGAGSAATPA